MEDFCFCVMSFGERYYKQTERFIIDRDVNCPNVKIIVLTDNVNYFSNFKNIIIKDIIDYSPTDINYAKNYYNFDFSVNRFLTKIALEEGFKKYVVLDNDNHFSKTFDITKFKSLFRENFILSPIVYNYGVQKNLGDKVLFYSKKFNFEIKKEDIKNLAEGCLNLYSFDTIERGYSFFNTWDECITIRDENKLFTNDSIQEKFFAGVKNGIHFDCQVVYNFFNAHHDTWYR